MLSPDPVTQAPENGQNYNRYSYAYNNPLKYTDPSGYKLFWTFSVSWGGAGSSSGSDSGGASGSVRTAGRGYGGNSGRNSGSVRGGRPFLTQEEWEENVENGLLPNGNMPVSRAGDNATDNSSDDRIVVVGAFTFVFEEGLEEYVEIFSDFVSGGYYDDILVGAGGGETIMVSAGNLPDATAMRYNGPKGTLTIDVARIRGEEDNKNVFSTGLIGSALGHELVHMSEYTFGKYDGSALSRARAEVDAFNWQLRTASRFGLTPGEYQGVQNSKRSWRKKMVKLLNETL